MMICILNLEIDLIWSFALLTYMNDQSISFLLFLVNMTDTFSANMVATQNGKQWVIGPKWILAILNETLPKYL